MLTVFFSCGGAKLKVGKEDDVWWTFCTDLVISKPNRSVNRTVTCVTSHLYTCWILDFHLNNRKTVTRTPVNRTVLTELQSVKQSGSNQNALRLAQLVCHLSKTDKQPHWKSLIFEILQMYVSLVQFAYFLSLSPNGFENLLATDSPSLTLLDSLCVVLGIRFCSALLPKRQLQLQLPPWPL